MSISNVHWTLDGENRHEISSKEHLIQLMHAGELYTNSGEVPSRFHVASYIQTVDIDLGHDANIKPIPTLDYGVYDGNNFTIFNWGYSDPNYATDSSLCEESVGLFATIITTVIKNVKMAGTCYIRGFQKNAGFVVGYSNRADVYNVSLNLSSGSDIRQGTTMNAEMNLGCVIGKVLFGSVTGATVEGELETQHDNSSGLTYAGGVLGMVNASDLSLLRNLATFTAPLSARNVGGVVGLARYGTISKLLNAMKGDLNTTGNAGGIIGNYRNDSSSSSCEGLVCSMQGNIDSTASHGGGIFGFYEPGTTGIPLTSLFNYMTGEIRAPSSTASNKCGGLIGWALAFPVIQTSIVAMKGYTQNTILGRVDSGSGTLATLNTEFGLTFDTDNFSTSDAVVGPSLDVSYFNLPYIEMTGTDAVGTVYDWEFVYGNETTLDLFPRAVNIVASFMPVTDAVGYKITVEGTAEGVSDVVTVSSGKTDVKYNIKSLDPETEYLVKVYYTTDGSVYESHLNGTATTQLNSASNYNMEDFKKEGGGYDVSALDSESSQRFYQVINDVLDTGDSVTISVGGGTTRSARFVKRGETVEIEGQSTLFVPFSSDAGSAQEVGIQLSDSSSVTLSYDETNGTVGIGGLTYSVGDFLVLDGKKISILEV